MTHFSFLKELYFKSLTPFEILKASRQYNCSFEKKQDIDYLDYWKKSISNHNSTEVFNNYFSANNLDNAEISLMISNISCLEENIDFPVWISALEDVLNQIDVQLIMSVEHPREAFYQLFFPYIDYFTKKLKQNLKTSAIVLSDHLINQLNTALYKGLFNIARLVLFNEFSKLKKEGATDNLPDDFYYKKFVLSILSDRFHHLFLKYPVLARRLSTKMYRYLNFITSLLQRFDTDSAELEYFFNTKPGLISQLHLNSGDQHNGESTVIIEFENGEKIVYKPANVSITNSYNQFLNWVNLKLGENLKTFKIIDKKTYGWLQFVEHSSCQSIDQVRLYYERAGILLGIAYFLNANDFHFENVIASGDSPVLIDHETIVGPKLKTLDKGKQTNKSYISGTILETSLIPVKDISLPFYRYGFGSSIPLGSNAVTTVLKIKDPNKDTMAIVPELEIEKLYKSNKPICNGKIENLVDYGAEFNMGFEKLYNLILENKAYLLSENSPVIDFCDLKIRFINRPTVVYYKILKLLDQPEYLADPIKYGTKLEILARAYETSENWSPILNSEREQLLLNDIPAFYINTSDNDITLFNEKIHLIKLNAVENIYNKIRNASLADYNDQMMLITDSIKL